MKVFSDESQLALATLSVDQLVRTKGSASATDGQTILWRIAASGVGITLANGNVAIALVNDKSGRKNLVLNPNLDLWQRGAGSFTGPKYTADRWYVSSGRTAIQSVDVPTGISNQPEFSLRASNTTSNPNIVTTVELPHAGNAGVFTQNKDFTISFWVKDESTGNGINFRASFIDDTLTRGNAVEIIPSTTTGTSDGTWQKIKYTFNIGSTVPAGTNLCLEMLFQVANTTGAFLITQVQLEQGPVATDFEYRPIAEELALCQRYYQTLSRIGLAVNIAGSNTVKENTWNYAVTMRAVGTITHGLVTGATTIIAQPNTDQCRIFTSDGTATSTNVQDLTADAEL